MSFRLVDWMCACVSYTIFTRCYD